MRRDIRIINAVVYVISAALLLLGVIFYRQPLLTVLLMMVILLLPLSFFITSKTIQLVEIDVAYNGGNITAGQTANFEFSVKNPSVFPLLNCCARFGIGNTLYRSIENEMVFPAEARKTITIKVPVETSKAGLVRVDFKTIEVNDFLNIMSFTLPFVKSIEIPVLPEEKEIVMPELKKVTVEAEEISTGDEGELTRDVKQVREYRPGDRLRDIHWKLSAKSDEFIVKEYEHAKDLYYMILPEFEYMYLKEDLENFYALGRNLIKGKESFRVALAGADESQIEIERVESIEDLQTVIFRIYELYAGLMPGKTSGAYDLFARQFPDMYGVIRLHGGRIIAEEVMEEY